MLNPVFGGDKYFILNSFLFYSDIPNFKSIGKRINLEWCCFVQVSMPTLLKMAALNVRYLVTLTSYFTAFT